MPCRFRCSVLFARLDMLLFVSSQEFPLHPAAILDDEGRLEDVVEHPGIDPSRSQGRFVVPVGMPNCTRPYNNDEQSVRRRTKQLLCLSFKF